MAARYLAASLLALWFCTPTQGLQTQFAQPTAFGSDPVYDPSKIAKIQQWMMDHALNATVQQEGCQMLSEIAEDGRGGTPPFPHMPLRVANKHLDAGIGEAFAQGALNTYKSTGVPEIKCLGGLTGLDVQYDNDKELRLINTTPHLWEAIVAGAKTGLLGPCTFAGLVGGIPESIESLHAAGGFDYMMSFLQSHTSDDAEFQAALCGLSDNVQSGGRKAAEYIANWGGTNHGINVFVQLMPLTLGRHFQEGNGFGLQYEMVHDTTGLLRQDDADHTWRKEFYRLGYLEHLVALMADDPSDNHLQDNCCQAIYYMIENNATVQRDLANRGAIDLIAKALNSFAPKKLIGYCTVTHSCSTALLTFARANPLWLYRIKQLQVGKALTDDVILFDQFMTSGTPGSEYFPSSNILELSRLLK